MNRPPRCGGQPISACKHTQIIMVVPTKNSERGEKSRVLRLTAVVSPACSRSCVPSSPFLPADSAAGRFWDWRTLALRHQLARARLRRGGVRCQYARLFGAFGVLSRHRRGWRDFAPGCAHAIFAARFGRRTGGRRIRPRNRRGRAEQKHGRSNGENRSMNLSRCAHHPGSAICASSEFGS
jgi:hypothetical protein